MAALLNRERLFSLRPLPIYTIQSGNTPIHPGKFFHAIFISCLFFLAFCTIFLNIIEIRSASDLSYCTLPQRTQGCFLKQ